MSITLAQLRTEARQRADMENSEFVSDSELNGYINNSISELHDLLIQTYDGDYYVSEATFTTSGSADSYALSSIITSGDFYKLRGVDAKLNGTEWRTLKPFSFNERNRNNYVYTDFGIAEVRYRLVGSNLRFTPVPDNNIYVKVWYIPVAQTLVNDSDSYDDLNNFSEYVILDVAIKMLDKEESDTTKLEAKKLQLMRRIEGAAGNRDAGEGEAVRDVYSINDDFNFGQ